MSAPPRIVELMQAQLTAEYALQAELDRLVPPTATGYLRAACSWQIVWVRSEGGHVDLALAHPEGAHEWDYVTTERLMELQLWLNCDRIYARSTKKGPIYIAAWDLK